ncbi:MAG: DUF2939 domain-containing protein [Sphingomonas sp.]|uniref:DUF2939 domain-containing protein n=1 Tax=Sphingomonas sp. TaxID=28214 RepID=UPI001AC217EA|nr:DUF2939 domain-containing protein [Sphingomonas sp.]MBN8806947.1 DUF2939 domain-containing protein [Sphingomonas sp.]
MRKWIIAIVVVALVAGAGWYFGSPWWTLYQVKEAAERKDVDALIGYIDFDALRADLKVQMHEAARKDAAADHSPIDPAAEAMADESMDSQVTPANVRSLLRDQFAPKPKASGGAATSGGAKSPSPIDQIGKDIAVDRTSFDSFVVQGRDKPDGVRLTFARRGLGWKLAGLRLPDNLF